MTHTQKRIRTWATGLAAVMSLSLVAACAGGSNGEDVNTGNTGAGSTTTSGAQGGNGGAAEAPFEITMMATQHAAEVPDDLIPGMIEEKTNTKLSIQWVPSGSYQEKLNAAFATGSLPMAVSATNTDFAKEAIRNDQFWEIGPLLAEYENLSNLNPDVLQNTAVDGKIYSLYMERPLSRQGVIYRKDWADNLGLEAPQTTEDLYEMIRAFTEDDPDQNGQDDTIGLTDRSDLIYGAFKTVSSYFGTPNYWYIDEGDQFKPEFMHEAFKDTLDYLHDIHSKGYMNQDFPVTSKTDQIDLLVNGKAGVYIGSMPDVLTLSNQLADMNPDAELTVQNGIKGPRGRGVWAIPGYGSIVLFPKSAVKSEEDLHKILAFYDQLMTAENANLLTWGVEGEHYEIKDGLANKTVDQVTDNTIVKPNNAWGIGGPDTIDGMLKGYFELPARALAEELVEANNSMLIHDPSAPLDSPTYIERGQALQQIITDATYQYVLGDLDAAGFQKAIDRWKSEGGDKIMQEYTEAYQAQQ
ncbi:extracellular solute-binding protein [Paenibacillus sp. IB182496]|uniref:Extracellular solute-binding protein n=1 Tax=Paenibacillus sabuli TaxID=2772509 RepID=A0A927BSK6_9BACL|nr:extracellular solute-binding protein [Paenibacillus sabuli]MBD2845527.1 extracellular solute-binding protein [Paenibacillus sabuli]